MSAPTLKPRRRKVSATTRANDQTSAAQSAHETIVARPGDSDALLQSMQIQTRALVSGLIETGLGRFSRTEHAALIRHALGYLTATTPQQEAAAFEGMVVHGLTSLGASLAEIDSNRTEAALARALRAELQQERALKQSLLHEIDALNARAAAFDAKLNAALMMSARSMIEMIAAKKKLTHLHEAEFKVFSQFGEDGIIQYLVRAIGVPPRLRKFVEFGVQDYDEANTLLLLKNDNWRGLVIDGSEEYVDAIKSKPIYWLHDLTAVAAFLHAENINTIIGDAGYGGEIGLLSIDVDGVDYWIWKALDAVDPMIVIVEYNSIYGAERAVTVPYDPSFLRSKAHHSHLYAGCSLKALEMLGASKGYSLVGSNSAGNNAFFVRNDCLRGLCTLSAQEAYVESQFRESRDSNGELNYLAGKARLREIRDMPLYDVELGRLISAGELLVD